MNDKPKYNPNIHKRRSIRLKGYDYSQVGLYFITICCKNREHCFGEIRNGEMILNDAGIIANDCWLQIPNHFPNSILHEHIVMPNHIHGIIELKCHNVGAENIPPKNVNMNEKFRANNDYNGANDDYNGANDDYNGANNDYNGANNDYNGANNDYNGANNDYNRANNDYNRANNDSPLRSPSKSIGSIVRGFKIGVTKWMRQNTNVHDVWQRNYYEHIIRNDQSYQTISNYIINNPAKWADDKFYK